MLNNLIREVESKNTPDNDAFYIFPKDKSEVSEAWKRITSFYEDSFVHPKDPVMFCGQEIRCSEVFDRKVNSFEYENPRHTITFGEVQFFRYPNNPDEIVVSYRDQQRAIDSLRHIDRNLTAYELNKRLCRQLAEKPDSPKVKPLKI